MLSSMIWAPPSHLRPAVRYLCVQSSAAALMSTDSERLLHVIHRPTRMDPVTTDFEISHKPCVHVNTLRVMRQAAKEPLVDMVRGSGWATWLGVAAGHGSAWNVRMETGRGKAVGPDRTDRTEQGRPGCGGIGLVTARQGLQERGSAGRQCDGSYCTVLIRKLISFMNARRNSLLQTRWTLCQ